MESGTCNVCYAPCSSCMHINEGFAGSKSDVSSEETCHGLAASQCSVNENDVVRSSRGKTHNNPNNLGQEAFSENAESKEILRSCEVSDDSGAVEMSSKASSAGIVLDQGSKFVKAHDDKTSDAGANKVNLDYPDKNAGSKDSADCSALVSDPVLDGSCKDHDSLKIDPCNVLPDEAKSQSLNPEPSPEDKNSSGMGNNRENSGAESNGDSETMPSEGSNLSGQDGKNEKSVKNTLLHKTEDPNSSVMSENESDDSEMVEHDVKVCDICGDAGREDLLAICSRCSDGAEHTYCMREMIEEVPEGDWLCEECKFAEEAEKQKLEAKRKRENDIYSNAQSVGKRQAEKTEAAPDAKAQAVEGSNGSPKKSTVPRIAALSRESSFKSLDKTKRNLVHQASFTNDNAESARSAVSTLQSARGTFSQSNSLNGISKPKVKHIDDVVLPRQRTVKEHASLEGVSRTLGKSMSFRSTELGGSLGNDSKVKAAPSKFYHPQEVKGAKQFKEQRSEASPSASMRDQKLISRGNSSLAHAKNTRDFKGLQSDSKHGSLKQGSNLTRTRLENPVAPVGESPKNEKRNSSEQTSHKDEHASVSRSAEGLISHANVISKDILHRSRESRETREKSKGVFPSNRPRPSVLSGSKGLTSQKEEHTTEPIDVPCASDSDLSATRKSREEINKGNRLRAAVDAVLRKKPSFGKNRESEQTDRSSVSSMDPNCDKTSQSQLSSKTTKNEGLLIGQSKPRTASDPHKQTITTNEKQLPLSTADAIYSPRSVDSQVNLPSPKPVTRDWPSLTKTLLPKISAIPEHDYIWQGDLEVQRSRNILEMHSGIQAHISTLASSKVKEVINKFPMTVPLNEVPRLSTWPAQFRDIGAKEDHIALFFFAKDMESYGKYYKPLVDNVMKKDLALKGNFDGVELLIFASNQLPQHCQRWNMLYFLWGVLRGRRESCSNLQKNPSLPSTSNTAHSSSKRMSESSCNTVEAQNNKEPSSIGSPRFMSSSTQSGQKEETALREDAASVSSIPLQAAGPQYGPNDSEKASSASSGDGSVKMIHPIEAQKVMIDDMPKKDEETSGGGDTEAAHPPRRENTLQRNLSCGQTNNSKRPFIDLTTSDALHSSDSSEKVQLNDLNIEVLSEESAKKKLKSGSGGDNECSVSGKASSNDSKCDVDHKHFDEKIVKKNPEAAERIVFPLDLNDVKEDIEMVDNLTPKFQGLVPNLELALGAEETTGNIRGLLPFFAGPSLADHGSRREEGDSEAASLSLSLSFPSPREKEQSQTTTTTNVNTPLFLFRDFPDRS